MRCLSQSSLSISLFPFLLCFTHFLLSLSIYLSSQTLFLSHFLSPSLFLFPLPFPCVWSPLPLCLSVYRSLLINHSLILLHSLSLAFSYTLFLSTLCCTIFLCLSLPSCFVSLSLSLLPPFSLSRMDNSCVRLNNNCRMCFANFKYMCSFVFNNTANRENVKPPIPIISSFYYIFIHTYIHTYIYIYICVCVCVCV